MKKYDSKLLLKDFLETTNIENSVYDRLDVAIECVMDGNLGSAMFQMDAICNDVFEAIPKITKEKSLFRFTGFPDKIWKADVCPIISDIKNNSITLSSPKKFNDPMDPLIKAWIQRRKSRPEDNIDQKFYELIDKILDHIWIGCLVDPLQGRKRINKLPSIEDCNPLMWAHYAQKHKGVCIQYKIKPSNMINSDNMIVRLLDVDYDKPFPLNGNIPFIDSLRTKGDFWKYEKESRLVLYSFNRKEVYETLHGYEIEAIYMGGRIDREKRDCLINILQGSDIRLYQMVFSTDNIAKLESKEIKTK